MKDWESQYIQKITSKEEAIKNIISNSRVVVGHAAGEPTIFLDELVNQRERLHNVEIVHMVPLSECMYCLPNMESHFRHNSLFAGASTPRLVWRLAPPRSMSTTTTFLLSQLR